MLTLGVAVHQVFASIFVALGTARFQSPAAPIIALIVAIAFPSSRLLTYMNVRDFGSAAFPASINALPAARASGF